MDTSLPALGPPFLWISAGAIVTNKGNFTYAIHRPTYTRSFNKVPLPTSAQGASPSANIDYRFYRLA